MPNIRGYRLPIALRQTAASVANSVVWAMRNLGIPNRPVWLRRLQVNASFDGTAAASTSEYQLQRFRTATPSGGAALTVVKHNTDDGASVITYAEVLDTGLTVAGVDFDTSGLAIGAPRQVGASSQFDFEWEGLAAGGANSGMFIVKPTDGICLRLGVAAVIGDALRGYIYWEEAGGAY